MDNTKTIMKFYEARRDPKMIYRAKATNGNTKLGKNIFNINLPPVITCNPEAPCFKECYGRHGNFCFKVVVNSMQRNLFAFCQNPKRFFDDIIDQTELSLYVRWFGDGDMPNEEFLKGMCHVARINKGVHYLAFTKQYHIVNNYVATGHRIPKNLTIVFSCWRDWLPYNPYNFPTTWVRFPEEKKKSITWAEIEKNKRTNALIPAKAFKCNYDCAHCQHCWHMKKGDSTEFKKH